MGYINIYIVLSMTFFLGCQSLNKGSNVSTIQVVVVETSGLETLSSGDLMVKTLS